MDTEKLVNTDADDIGEIKENEASKDAPPNKDNASAWQRLRRFVVIEPYFMLYIVAGHPSKSLREQYFYYAVGQSMGINTNNLTSNMNQTCGDQMNDTAYQQRELVQAQTARLQMYIQLATFIPYIISMLLYGAYSDKLGRRLLFIMPPIGACVDVSIQMSITYFRLPVEVFYVASIGSMVCGSSSLVYIAIYSYIADTVAPHKMAIRMIIIDVIGSFLGGFVQLGIGYWIRESYLWPYCFIGGCYMLSIIYAVFLIPETIQRNPLDSKFKFKDITRSVKLFIKDDGSNRLWKLRLLTLSLMVEILFMFGFSVFSQFEMNVPLCWNSVMIGYFGAATDTIRGIGGIVALFFKRWMTDHWMALIGKVTFTAEMLYMSLVQSTLMMYFVPLISFFGVISMPVLRTMLSNLVRQDEQGALFSLVHCMMLLIMLFSGTLGKKIYEMTLFWWPGFVFLLSAIGAAIATLLIMLYIVGIHRERKLGQPLVNATDSVEEEEEVVDSIEPVG